MHICEILSICMVKFICLFNDALNTFLTYVLLLETFLLEETKWLSDGD